MFDFKKATELLDETEENLPAIVEEMTMTSEQAVEKLRESIKIDALQKQASDFTIANVEHATNALSMALQARKLSAGLIESKREITKPQMDFQRAINKLVSDYVSKLEEIENNLKDKIETWINTTTDEAFSSGLDSIQVIDGSLKRVNTWVYEVEDSAQVPFEYMCPDTEAIEKAIKSGLRNIPGVRVFMKQEIKLRVKN